MTLEISQGLDVDVMGAILAIACSSTEEASFKKLANIKKKNNNFTKIHILKVGRYGR